MLQRCVALRYKLSLRILLCNITFNFPRSGSKRRGEIEGQAIKATMATVMTQ